MTAIAGLWRFDGRPDAADGCARMLASLQIYGRDALGTWADRDIALGRRLARLLPEDVHDRQPLKGRNDIVLVADLRLDNREELAAALGLSGERLHTASDAAVLLAAYERWDIACFDRIVGEYAFAVWDGARHRLVLARDPLGMRPLYYHRTDALFAFASMPKGLHALPEVPYAANEERLAEFLTLMPDRGTATYFEGIEKVEPACFAVVTPSGVTMQAHWEPKRETLRLGSPEAYAEAMREKLDEAVRCRLRGATDVGAQLSGGFDSAAVAATAARLLPSGGRVYAFTAVPRKGYTEATERPRFIDEGPLAAATAAMHPNIEHIMLRTGGRSPLDGLDRNFLLYDQPVLNLCNAVWADAINDAGRERKLTVMLTGGMGNHTISYTGLELLPELLSRGRLLHWAGEAMALRRNSGVRWRGIAAKTIGPWVPAPLWHFLRRLNGNVEHDLHLDTVLRPERVRELGLIDRARERQHDTAYRPWKDGYDMRLWSIRRGGLRAGYRKGVLAGWRLDLRDPTADRRLLEFCLSVPTDQFLRNGRTRALARRALADRLPAAVLNSRLKGYQAADWHEGLTAARASLADEIDMLEACAPAAKVIATDRMRRLMKAWPVDGWENDTVTQAYRYALLRGISAGHFLRRVAGTNASTKAD